MKAYHLEKVGSLDGIVLREQEIPTPGPNEVLVRIRATSLNRRELMILNGIILCHQSRMLSQLMTE